MNRQFLILCNPASGKGNGARVLAMFEQFLNTSNIAFVTCLREYPADLSLYTDMAVIGGDGTLNHVLNHYRHIDIPITILRGGSGNDYCNLLHGRSSDLNQQFETAVSGLLKKVDAGICNEKIFINGVGIGFDGKVAGANMKKKILWGKAAYYYTILRFILFYKESKARIICPGEQWECNLFMLSVAKGKTYGGGFRVAPDAETDNGLLRVISVSQISILNRLRYLPVIEKGKHLQLPMVKGTNARFLELHATRPLEAHLDGEWMSDTHFSIALLPAKYSFRVPL